MENEIFITWPQLVFLSVSALALSCAGTFFLPNFLKKIGLVDKPNKRSNHKKIVARGGGIAVIGTFVLVFSIMTYQYLSFLWPVLVSGIFLALISFIDDIKPLHPILRLLSQIIACGFILIQPHQPLFGDFFPAWLDSAIVVFLWVWFINLYNFMDGIDGITCSETISICVGICLISIFASFPPEIGVISFLLALCCIGFMPFNWHPAKIFLGDVGSVPLGFFIGWMLLVLAMYGYWQAAIILPIYYLADSGITLFKRILNREKIWEAHSKHFYQIAVRAGLKHSTVVLIISAFNLIFVALALASSMHNSYALIYLIIASILSFILLYYLKQNEKSSK